MSASPKLFIVTIVALLLAAAGYYAYTAHKPAAAGIFTAAQANAGQREYGLNCAPCHGNALNGGAGPALAGVGFMSAWGPKSGGELYQYISTSMPAGNPGTLGQSSYTAITAFILQFNGAGPGAQPFNGSTDLRIAALTSRKMCIRDRFSLARVGLRGCEDTGRRRFVRRIGVVTGRSQQ